MKKFLTISCLISFLFSGNLKKINEEIVKLNMRNVEVMQNYSECMQKSKNRNSQKVCIAKKNRERIKIRKKKKYLYGLLKKERINHQKETLLNYSKNVKSIKEDKNGFDRNY